jgi:hypothetical protein
MCADCSQGWFCIPGPTSIPKSAATESVPFAGIITSLTTGFMASMMSALNPTSSLATSGSTVESMASMCLQNPTSSLETSSAAVTTGFMASMINGLNPTSNSGISSETDTSESMGSMMSEMNPTPMTSTASSIPVFSLNFPSSTQSVITGISSLTLPSIAQSQIFGAAGTGTLKFPSSALQVSGSASLNLPSLALSHLSSAIGGLPSSIQSQLASGISSFFSSIQSRLPTATSALSEASSAASLNVPSSALSEPSRVTELIGTLTCMGGSVVTRSQDCLDGVSGIASQLSSIIPTGLPESATPFPTSPLTSVGPAPIYSDITSMLGNVPGLTGNLLSTAVSEVSSLLGAAGITRVGNGGEQTGIVSTTFGGASGATALVGTFVSVAFGQTTAPALGGFNVGLSNPVREYEIY